MIAVFSVLLTEYPLQILLLSQNDFVMHNNHICADDEQEGIQSI
jgi:hypothetical protein